MIASVVALRQAFAASTGRAVAIVVVAFLAMVVVLVIIATVFGISFMAFDCLTRRSTYAIDVVEARVGRELAQSLPSPIDDPGLEERVQAAVADSGRKIVALDDDPTGVQTVHGVAVLARWASEALAAELRNVAPLFYPDQLAGTP